MIYYKNIYKLKYYKKCVNIDVNKKHRLIKNYLLFEHNIDMYLNCL